MRKLLMLLLVVTGCPLPLFSCEEGALGRPDFADDYYEEDSSDSDGGSSSFGELTEHKKVDLSTLSKVSLMSEFPVDIQNMIHDLGLYEKRELLWGIQEVEGTLLANILLSYAAAQGKKSIAHTLIKDYSADPNFDYQEGITPIDIAQKNGHSDLSNYLRLELV